MGTLLQDIRYGLRQLRRSPGYTAVAIVILALGIGASTAIFSVLYAAILRPLPYDHPDQMVFIYRADSRSAELGVSGLEFLDWEKQATAFSALTIVHFSIHYPVITDSSSNDVVEVYGVTKDFFKVFGVQAAEGRLFGPDDDQPGRDRSVVLGDSFQAKGPGRESAVIGGKLTLDREDYAVLGRVPASFHFPELDSGIPTEPEAYVSLPLDKLTKGGRQDASFWVVGRLKPGVTLAQAQAQMSTIAAREGQEHPDTNAGVRIRVVPLRDHVNRDTGRIYMFLLITLGLLLLLACVNVAVLLLVQGVRRQQEIAIRLAVGASRARVAFQLLTESTLLALAGGAAGVLLAYWFKAAMLSLSPPWMIPKTYPVTMNFHVLGFALLVSVTTGILFGVAPALQLSRVSLAEIIKEGARAGGAGMRTLRLRNMLVVAEVGLALSLLIVCGITIRSLADFLFSFRSAYDPRKVVVALAAVPSFKYPKFETLHAYFRGLVEQVSALPGVESAALCSPWGARVALADNPITPRSIMQGPNVNWDLVSPSFFRTLQVSLLRGRLFASADYVENPSVIVVSASLAEKLWPHQDALGKRLTTTYPPQWYQVVGIVSEDRTWGGPFSMGYLPKYNTYETVYVRTAGDAKNFLGLVRAAITHYDKDIGVRSIETLEQGRSRAGAPIRYIAAILITIAVIALLLATIGISAVTAYAVSQRSHEIGIRIALGARGRTVVLLMMRQGMLLTSLGLTLGLILTPAFNRTVGRILPGVTPAGAATYVGVSLLFVAATLLACYMSARRATKVDPMVALRYE